LTTRCNYWNGKPRLQNPSEGRHGITLNKMAIILPSSKPQASVATFLEEFRRLYLQQALSNAIAAADLRTINAELDHLAPAEDLKALASRGIRGEFLFALPSLLKMKPNLLGYYRLLLGYSQKEFYNKTKLGRFKCMEDSGRLTPKLETEFQDLCAALIQKGSELLHAIGSEKMTLDLLDDLTLLTLGPQLRGSKNTQIGIIANRAVFEIIQQIVKHAILKATESRLEILNAAKRNVMIAFSADPDISISEKMATDERNIVAIEIKGGADASNIWNRLGEAEKSHQSAKQRGFVEFWTIYNVPHLDLHKARVKSPTTNRFYSLIELSSPASEEFADFRERLLSLVGIAAAPNKLSRKSKV
jgi:XcyI restriction endonuclease